MNISQRNLAILASDLITIKVAYAEGPALFTFLASPKDNYVVGGYALVEARDNPSSIPKDCKLAKVIEIDTEADIDIELKNKYRFAVCPVDFKTYLDRKEQLDMATADVGKARRNVAKKQIVEAMLGNGINQIRGLSFDKESADE